MQANNPFLLQVYKICSDTEENQQQSIFTRLAKQVIEHLQLHDYIAWDMYITARSAT